MSYYRLATSLGGLLGAILGHFIVEKRVMRR